MLLVHDRPLLDGFRAGKPEAMKRVYLHYRPQLQKALRGGFSFRSGERWLRFHGYRSDFELEQAVHETMSRALLPQARMAYDGIRPYGDYLFGIARNHVLGQLRRNDPLVPVGGGDEAMESGGVDPGTPNPEPTIEEREVEGLLARFLEQSTPVEQRLFHLRFRDEQPQDEAARGMGLSRIRLRRIEYKLKRRLLAYLKKNGYLTGVSQAVLGVGLRSVLWSVLS